MHKCNIWFKNALRNPFTGRAIKHSGPTYNKLYKFCISKVNCSDQYNNHINQRTNVPVNLLERKRPDLKMHHYQRANPTQVVQSRYINTYDTYNLNRFITAQDKKTFGQSNYDMVVNELRTGKKTSHWIWYIFPQFKGLGISEMSKYYAIQSLAEAQAYIRHPVLGTRYIECVSILLELSGLSSRQIFSADSVKVHSSLTLFYRADPNNNLIRRALIKYYNGVIDDKTDRIIA